MYTLKAMCSNKKYPSINNNFLCGCNSNSKFSSYEEYIVVVKALITVVKSFSPPFMKNKQFKLYS